MEDSNPDNGEVPALAVQSLSDDEIAVVSGGPECEVGTNMTPS